MSASITPRRATATSPRRKIRGTAITYAARPHRRAVNAEAYVGTDNCTNVGVCARQVY